MDNTIDVTIRVESKAAKALDKDARPDHARRQADAA